jgi:hypothetical protein
VRVRVCVCVRVWVCVCVAVRVCVCVAVCSGGAAARWATGATTKIESSRIPSGHHTDTRSPSAPTPCKHAPSTRDARALAHVHSLTCTRTRTSRTCCVCRRFKLPGPCSRAPASASLALYVNVSGNAGKKDGTYGGRCPGVLVSTTQGLSTGKGGTSSVASFASRLLRSKMSSTASLRSSADRGPTCCTQTTQGRTCGRQDMWKAGQVEGRTGARQDRWKAGQVEGETGGRRDRWKAGQVEGRTGAREHVGGWVGVSTAAAGCGGGRGSRRFGKAVATHAHTRHRLQARRALPYHDALIQYRKDVEERRFRAA